MDVIDLRISDKANNYITACVVCGIETNYPSNYPCCLACYTDGSFWALLVEYGLEEYVFFDGVALGSCGTAQMVKKSSKRF